MRFRFDTTLRHVAFLTLSVAAVSAHAIVGGTLDSPISGYQYDSQLFNATGNGTPGGAAPIAPNWLVTAAHTNVVAGYTFTNPDGVFTVTNVVNEPTGADLSLLQVTRVGGGSFTHYYGYGTATTGSNPAANGLNTVSGSMVTMVGYGNYSSAIGNAPTTNGIARYYATNTVDQLVTANFSPGGPITTDYIYDLDDNTSGHNTVGGMTATAREGGIADYDSGNAWFSSRYGAPMIVAVSSGVFSQQGLLGTGSGNFYDAGGAGVGVDLAAYSSFIQSTIGIAPVPEPSAFAALGLGALAFLRRRKRA